MQKIRTLLTESKNEMKNTKNITLLAMLAAIAVLLGYFTIQVGEFLKIGFSSLPHEYAAYLFGPVTGALFGGALDILKYLVRPTGPFFPGFTISGIISGLIYGFVLYKKPVKFSTILLANAIVAVLVDMILNTAWLSVLYGEGFIVLLPLRIIKSVIMWPINSILVFTIIKATGNAFKSKSGQ
jgi:ECF transporter S component (folate family)